MAFVNVTMYPPQPCQHCTPVGLSGWACYDRCDSWRELRDVFECPDAENPCLPQIYADIMLLDQDSVWYIAAEEQLW